MIWQSSSKRRRERRSMASSDQRPTRTFLPPIQKGPVFLVCGGNVPDNNDQRNAASGYQTRQKSGKKNRKNENDQRSGNEDQIHFNPTKSPSTLPSDSQGQVWGAVLYTETPQHEESMEELHTSHPGNPSCLKYGRGKGTRQQTRRHSLMAPKTRHIDNRPAEVAEDTEVRRARKLAPEYSHERTSSSKERHTARHGRSHSSPLTNEVSHEVAPSKMLPAEMPPSTANSSGEEPQVDGGDSQPIPQSDRPAEVHWSSFPSANAESLCAVTLQLTKPDSPGPGVDRGREEDRQSRRYTERLQRLGLCDLTDPAAQERTKVRVMYKRFSKKNATNMCDSSRSPRSADY